MYVRSVRDLDVGGLHCYLQFPVYKICCKCGHRGFEKLDFVREYARCTRRFEEYVARLCNYMSVKEASLIVGLDWKTVKTIDKNSLREGLPDIRKAELKRIGVDEVAIGKGHRYITVVRDIDTSSVVWVGIGRKELSLDLFFAVLGREKSMGIKVVVMDMWDPYIASVRNNTEAEIVFDKFHVAKKANEALDNIRKKEFAKADPRTRKEWKKKRYIILTREKNLPCEKKETLRTLLDNNETLNTAYILKEQLLNIMDEQDETNAMARLQTWKDNVAESGFEEYRSLVKTLDQHMYGIQNYFKHHLTNAGSEGFNNKINVIKRRSYGFHDTEYLMLKILRLCGKPSSNIRR
jgi:transposase